MTDAHTDEGAVGGGDAGGVGGAPRARATYTGPAWWKPFVIVPLVLLGLIDIYTLLPHAIPDEYIWQNVLFALFPPLLLTALFAWRMGLRLTYKLTLDGDTLECRSVLHRVTLATADVAGAHWMPRPGRSPNGRICIIESVGGRPVRVVAGKGLDAFLGALAAVRPGLDLSAAPPNLRYEGSRRRSGFSSG